LACAWKHPSSHLCLGRFLGLSRSSLLLMLLLLRSQGRCRLQKMHGVLLRLVLLRLLLLLLLLRH
jgi:hypothetical protein